jgi:hypothetical protein
VVVGIVIFSVNFFDTTYTTSIYANAVKGLSFGYFLVLLYMTTLSQAQARAVFGTVVETCDDVTPIRKHGQIITLYEPDTQDCRVMTPERFWMFDNIVQQLDWFIVAHVVEWTLKSLVIRDYKLAWVLNIASETVEYSLSHVIPTFDE